MNGTEIIFLCLGICIVFWIIIILTIRHIKRVKKLKEKNIVETKTTRYTLNEDIQKENGEINISYIKKDNIISQNETIIFGKKGGIKAGKYTILSTNEDNQTFNIRLGDYVREYRHGSEIIVKDGESLTPVSCSIILR